MDITENGPYVISSSTLTLDDISLDDGNDMKKPCKWSKADLESSNEGPRHARRIAATCGTAIFLLFVIAAIYKVTYPASQGRQVEGRIPAHRPCGVTALDAQRRNCIFDLPNFSWLPPDCVDRDLSQEYLASQPEWEFFLDRNKTTKVSVEEVAKGTWQYFITGRVHVAHCTFTWLHFQKALTEGRKVHGQSNIGHVRHCSEVLRQNRTNPDEVEIRVNVAFPDCGFFSTEYPG